MHTGWAYHDPSLREIIHRRRKRVLNVLGPVVQRTREAAENSRSNDIDHEVTEQVQAIDRRASGSSSEDLIFSQ